jgi:probable phosphoglycerate mutase
LQTDNEIELILVRHGETTWNAARRVQGHSDESVLTTRGLAQAAELAEQLACEHVDALWVSDLQRARATAEPLADQLGLSVQVHSGLRERNFGSYEGGPVDSLSPSVTGVSTGGVAGGFVVDPDVAPPGGETIRQFHDRVASAIGEIVAGLRASQRNQRVVLVTHGGTIRVALGFLSGRPLEHLDWGEVPNGAVIAHRFSPSLTEDAR